MHITLTGNLGSGKSTISKCFEKEYGFEIYSTGKVIRELAEEMGITVLEMNKRMTEDPQYDHMIDDKSTRISEERQADNIFFDSRLAWHFVGKAFRVFLSVSLDEAVRRIMGDNRGSVETYQTPEDCKKALQDRVAEEDKRYKELYNINYFDFNNYNLVLDSTACPAEILAKIMHDEAEEFYKVADDGKKHSKLIICKERGLADFEEAAANCKVTEKNLYGHDFYVIEL